MILLDTDHATVLLFRGHSQYNSLAQRLLTSPDTDFVLSVVSLEEQLRGWLSKIARRKKIHEHVPVYSKLTELVEFCGRWRLLPFDSSAASSFEDLRSRRIRIGAQDLKIASIALANDALLLSANLVDFQRVPGLKVEDWLYS